MLELLFLGTGCAFCKKLFQTNAFLSLGNTNLLIDCGYTCSRSFVALGKHIKEVDNIFITHFHADHIGGLEELALSFKYFYNKRATLYIAEDMADSLWTHCLRGGLEESGNGRVNIDFYFDVVPVKKTFLIDQYEFEIIPTLHVPGMKSYGLYFNEITFTSDIIFNKPFIMEMEEKSRIIFHDCTFIKNPVHTYFEEMLDLPKPIRNKIWLEHYNDGYEKHLPRVKEEGFHLVEQNQLFQFLW